MNKEIKAKELQNRLSQLESDFQTEEPKVERLETQVNQALLENSKLKNKNMQIVKVLRKVSHQNTVEKPEL